MTTDDAARGDDVYHVDSPLLTAFIGEVHRVLSAEPNRARVVQHLRIRFRDLLSDQSWLPDQFCRPDTVGGMGGGIGNYLIYRSAARDLTLMSLVVPPNASTPIHDHLAWGLVGLYGGQQDEWVYRRADDRLEEGTAELVQVEQRRLNTGDFYELLPPAGDIHRVATVGDMPSISLHLLGNDVGCVWRHRYDVERRTVQPFRSSYSNDPCTQMDR